MANKKYELVTTDTIKEGKATLTRIRALKDFGRVKVGDLGGYVESEKNLSSDGICWVFDEAKVYGSADVFEDALISYNAKVYGNAEVYGKASVYGVAKVYENAQVYGNAKVCGKARVCGNAKVYGDTWVSDSAKVLGHAVLSGKDKAIDKDIVNVDGNTIASGNDKALGATLPVVKDKDIKQRKQINAKEEATLSKGEVVAELRREYKKSYDDYDMRVWEMGNKVTVAYSITFRRDTYGSFFYDNKRKITSLNSDLESIASKYSATKYGGPAMKLYLCTQKSCDDLDSRIEGDGEDPYSEYERELVGRLEMVFKD